MIVDLTLTAASGADEESTTTVPTPQNPAPGMSDESTAVTAGLGGFLVVFAMGLAVWVLGRDLTRRLRRMNRAEQQRADGQQDSAKDTAAAASQRRPSEPVDRDPLA
ncbi:HAMP domain-containing protein [Ornithinimicrobium pratense]|uniref:HAMP domain-containing protein n=1 Tax=Ornithinimicrobium pratense TaxID=2593973 RepID=A0A5J6V467_9MICO|nr:HAMP domain-containing protein [Ornithinimicrobium pratense]QFG67773.1 HAMP domain-containing protein [Ornithinimicrobium pratense]